MKNGNSGNTYHHGNLQAALIAAAVNLIAEKGVDQITVREVARRAGVSHTAPYRHFKDKDALLAAVAKEGFDTMAESMRRQFAEYPDDPLRRFEISGLAYVDFAIAHPSHYRVMFGPWVSKYYHLFEELTRSASAAFQLLLDCIRDCQAHSLIRAGDPMNMALAAWSLVHGLSSLIIDQHIHADHTCKADIQTIRKIVVQTLYAGLKA